MEIPITIMTGKKKAITILGVAVVVEVEVIEAVGA